MAFGRGDFRQLAQQKLQEEEAPQKGRQVIGGGPRQMGTSGVPGQAPAPQGPAPAGGVPGGMPRQMGTNPQGPSAMQGTAGVGVANIGAAPGAAQTQVAPQQSQPIPLTTPQNRAIGAAGLTQVAQDQFGVGAEAPAAQGGDGAAGGAGSEMDQLYQDMMSRHDDSWGNIESGLDARQAAQQRRMSAISGAMGRAVSGGWAGMQNQAYVSGQQAYGDARAQHEATRNQMAMEMLGRRQAQENWEAEMGLRREGIEYGKDLDEKQQFQDLMSGEYSYGTINSLLDAGEITQDQANMMAQNLQEGYGQTSEQAESIEDMRDYIIRKSGGFADTEGMSDAEIKQYYEQMKASKEGK